ncbi:LuxR family transcriptional regulator [Rhodococcus sp. Rp3]|uniref:LuxR family transcriptional regulator n=1 Tax=Rhodococcus sp. Rp3 TaxID=2807635 RepID=UPI00233EFDBB|nr:LuxR family transcriptional regulator [Rhodococcus sp. Rp3]MDC3727032.1 LuxR family transcriptional regulator [Rhodococcus sp. Rp3]
MGRSTVLDHARAAFRAREWPRALDGFRRADTLAALSADDLDLFARAAYLTGHDDDSVALYERAFAAHLDAGETESAGISAFWLCFLLMGRGEVARAGGWLERARQSGVAERPDCATSGFLMIPGAVQQMYANRPNEALPIFTAAQHIGRACHDADLLALGSLGIGQCRVLLGDVEGGLRTLDEVLVSVGFGEVSPVVSGLVYCAVIETCYGTYHLQRAKEWTQALGRWCDDQTGLVPFRGQCLVHRAQMLQLEGDWSQAMDLARLALQRLSDPPGQPAMGVALYEQGELHRLRGEFAEADAAYRAAGRYGQEVQPGLALLRLRQGDTAAAVAGILRGLGEASNLDRPRMLAAHTEIVLATGDVAAARRSADELEALTRTQDAPALTAMADHAQGAVLLAEGDPCGALARLRRSGRHWRDLGAPYERARVRVLQGRCCAALGDDDEARLEFDSAASIFHGLHALPDLRELRVPALANARNGLTPREIQVLRAVATGRTNRAIAHEFVISEKTVARHLSNIFTKLDVSSRAAATAYAYEHRLL